MVAPLRDGVRAAIMAVRQGGEYQFTPLVAFVAFILGETVCLFDATQGTEITLLDSQPGVVKHGEVIYRNAISKSCRAIACYSPFLEVLLLILHSTAQFFIPDL